MTSTMRTAQRTIVYVDGFNLFYGALKGRGPGHKWLDLRALSRRLLPENNIVQIRYFTARVSARPHDPGIPERQQAYLRALSTLADVTVHHGEFKVSYPWMAVFDPTAPPDQLPKKVQVIKTEEKGSDVNIGSYLILDACRGRCEVAVVITNDSDLTEPVRLAREELGIAVGVVNPHETARRSRSLQGTFFRQLRRNTVRQCQFPEVLEDAAGRPVHRPAGW